MEQQWNNENNFDNVVEPETVTQGNNNDSKDTLSITSLILGIVGFLVNPLYIVSVLAIIFGAIGMNSNGIHREKGKVITIYCRIVFLFRCNPLQTIKQSIFIHG